MYSGIIKPTADFIAALLLLVFTCPLWIPVLIILFISNRGAAIFTQVRPGKNEKPFMIFKFKTMNDKVNAGGQLLPDHERLTGIGKFIRKTSLDELPQLINVLLGHMSLVGPRPLLMEYLALYSDQQARRHSVKPGITGWAQVNGRNKLMWKDKFVMDVWYADHQSFLLDLKILLLTLIKVVRAQDINAPDSATAKKFNGNN